VEAPAPRSLSLLEQQLLEIIETEQQLDAAAARPDADEREIQRQFHDLNRRYQGVIARNPDHLESRLLYGKFLSRYGDREGARDQFLSAAQIDPNIAVIHQELGTYYAEEGDHTRALAYALNAVELEPETAAYHYGLGQLLAAYRPEYVADDIFTSGQIDREMLEAFRTAARLEPDSLNLQFRYGQAFYDLANPDWEGALAHWQRLAERKDLNALQADMVRVNRIRCLVELGRTTSAESLLPAIERDSLRSQARALLDPSATPDNGPPGAARQSP
jgi:tetratricopeptide (TPR) repeat protein